MSPRPSLLAAAVLALALLAQSGCFLHAPEAVHLRKAFQRQYPSARFERDVALNVGPVSTAMAAGLLRRWAPDAFDTLGPYLRYVERVQLGIYSVEQLPVLDRRGSAVPAPHGGGRWKTVVRLREDKEHVWILTRKRRSPVRDLHVVVLSEDELVTARVEGDLEKLLQYTLRHHADEWLN